MEIEDLVMNFVHEKFGLRGDEDPATPRGGPERALHEGGAQEPPRMDPSSVNWGHAIVAQNFVLASAASHGHKARSPSTSGGARDAFRQALVLEEAIETILHR